MDQQHDHNAASPRHTHGSTLGGPSDTPSSSSAGTPARTQPGSADAPRSSPPGPPGYGDPPVSWTPPPQPPRPRGYALAAWAVILLLSLGMFLANTLDLRKSALSSDAPQEDRVGVLLMEMQAKYMVGAAEASPSNQSGMYRAARELNKGSIPQRQRFVILAGELAGRDEAAERLRDLDDLIERLRAERGEDTPLMTLEQSYVQSALRLLYLPEDEPADAPESVREGFANMGYEVEPLQVDRDLFVGELGWFGELALAPPWTDDAVARERIIQPAVRLMYLLVAVFVAMGFAGLLGFLGLIVFVVLAFMGSLRSAILPGRWHHGIYAETFAVWLVLFLGLQVASGVIARQAPQYALLIVFVMFFASLLALLWPVLRGIPWRDVKDDIGLNAGKQPALEPLIGIGGYLTALPVLLVGVILTLLFMKIQQLLGPPAQELDPTSGPAHPIVEQLAGDDWFPRIMVLLLGAVAAPIVEEIMFRGVLHRHLRDATGHMGVIVSIAIATLVNSFIFAIIHPQGWVAVPALMSLAIMFTMYREWRGTLVPPILMHAASNFIVLTLVMVMFNM